MTEISKVAYEEVSTQFNINVVLVVDGSTNPTGLQFLYACRA